MQPLIPVGKTPVDLHISHSEMRHSGGLNLTTCRGWGGHTYWKCSGGSGLMLMGAHAAQYLHIHNIWPPAPQFRQAEFLGHMGGVWLRGSGVWANRQGSNYLHESGGHSRARWAVPFWQPAPSSLPNGYSIYRTNNRRLPYIISCLLYYSYNPY